MSFKAVGMEWTLEAFEEWLNLEFPEPIHWASSVTIHHTAVPSLAQRPHGLTSQHIKNIAHFYESQLGWSRGPHLFIDDSSAPIKGMTPLNMPGTHARSFNATSIGIEVLGNYELEPHGGERGLQCWQNAAGAVSSILKNIGLKPSEESILFHRDDPRTSKTCPGSKVSKDWFISLVKAHSNETPTTPQKPATEIIEHRDAIYWQLSQILREDPRSNEEKYDLRQRVANIHWSVKQLTQKNP